MNIIDIILLYNTLSCAMCLCVTITNDWEVIRPRIYIWNCILIEFGEEPYKRGVFIVMNELMQMGVFS